MTPALHCRVIAGLCASVALFASSRAWQVMDALHDADERALLRVSDLAAGPVEASKQIMDAAISAGMAASDNVNTTLGSGARPGFSLVRKCKKKKRKGRTVCVDVWVPSALTSLGGTGQRSDGEGLDGGGSAQAAALEAAVAPGDVPPPSARYSVADVCSLVPTGKAGGKQQKSALVLPAQTWALMRVGMFQDALPPGQGRSLMPPGLRYVTNPFERYPQLNAWNRLASEHRMLQTPFWLSSPELVLAVDLEGACGTLRAVKAGTFSYDGGGQGAPTPWDPGFAVLGVARMPGSSCTAAAAAARGGGKRAAAAAGEDGAPGGSDEASPPSGLAPCPSPVWDMVFTALQGKGGAGAPASATVSPQGRVDLSGRWLRPLGPLARAASSRSASGATESSFLGDWGVGSLEGALGAYPAAEAADVMKSLHWWAFASVGAAVSRVSRSVASYAPTQWGFVDRTLFMNALRFTPYPRQDINVRAVLTAVTGGSGKRGGLLAPPPGGATGAEDRVVAAGIKRAMMPVWSHGSVPRMLTAFNVVLDQNGVVSSPGHDGDWLQARSCARINPLHKVRRHVPEAVSVTHMWAHNSYHFLGEALTRLYPLLPLFRDRPWVKLHVWVDTTSGKNSGLASSAPRLTPAHRESLAALGIAPSRIVWGTISVGILHIPDIVVCARPHPLSIVLAREAIRAAVGAPASPVRQGDVTPQLLDSDAALAESLEEQSAGATGPLGAGGKAGGAAGEVNGDVEGEDGGPTLSTDEGGSVRVVGGGARGGHAADHEEGDDGGGDSEEGGGAPLSLAAAPVAADEDGLESGSGSEGDAGAPGALLPASGTRLRAGKRGKKGKKAKGGKKGGVAPSDALLPPLAPAGDATEEDAEASAGSAGAEEGEGEDGPVGEAGEDAQTGGGAGGVASALGGWFRRLQRFTSDDSRHGQQQGRRLADGESTTEGSGGAGSSSGGGWLSFLVGGGDSGSSADASLSLAASQPGAGAGSGPWDALDLTGITISTGNMSLPRGVDPLGAPLVGRRRRGKFRKERSKKALAYPPPEAIPLVYRASNNTAGCMAGIRVPSDDGEGPAGSSRPLRVLIHKRAFSRRVMNHGEIASGAAALPAEVTVLDDVTLPHQRELWAMHARADVVIAANGAGLANLHAVRAGSALLEVVQYHHLSLHYAHMALALDIDYFGFVSPTEKFEDVWVEPDRLLGVLCRYARAKYGAAGDRDSADGSGN